MEAHSFMPGAPGRAGAPASLPPSTHVPDANPRAAAAAQAADGRHGFLPEAVAAPEQTLRQRHGSPSRQGSPEEPVRAAAGAADLETKQAGLRSSLTKLAHRYNACLRQVCKPQQAICYTPSSSFIEAHLHVSVCAWSGMGLACHITK